MHPPTTSPTADPSVSGWAPPDGIDAAYVVFPKDRRVVVSDGTPIAYTVLEPPPDRPRRTPVLMLNGWSCSDAYWADLAPALVASGHPCVLPDNRGHGASGLPRRPSRGARNMHGEDLSIKRMASDALEVLADAGIDAAVSMGHSMGVQTALETYRLDPGRIRGLALVAGSYENPLRTFYGTPLLALGFPVARTLVTTVPELAKPLWAALGNKQAGYWGARTIRAIGPKATADAIAPYLRHLSSGDPAVMVRAVDEMRRHSAADLLPRIEVPVIVLAGTHDTFTPPRCSREMFERIPTAEIHWFDKAGHTLPIEEPEEILAVFEEWYDRRVRPRAA